MTKKKSNSQKESTRHSVSRERLLALALRAVLDDIASDSEDNAKELTDSVDDATTTLEQLGYGSLIGIPKRLKELNEQLKAAVEAGDGKEISRLGLEIERAKVGKEATAEKAKVAGGE